MIVDMRNQQHHPYHPILLKSFIGMTTSVQSAIIIIIIIIIFIAVTVIMPNIVVIVTHRQTQVHRLVCGQSAKDEMRNPQNLRLLSKARALVLKAVCKPYCLEVHVLPFNGSIEGQTFAPATPLLGVVISIVLDRCCPGPTANPKP